MDDDHYSEPQSPPSLKQKLKHSLCFSCCFPHRRRRNNNNNNNHLRYYASPPPISSDEKPTLIWVQAEDPPDIKDKCRTVFSFIANANVKQKRPSSAEFRYDPLSYSLNFEDGYDDDNDAAPLRNFSARLPPSPPQPPVKSAVAVT
nr:uncharacterized protein LOC109217366 [Ipomoea batatas]